MINRAVIEAVAYGDARGLPYETRTKAQIAELGGVLPCFVAPDLHSDFKDFAGFPIGTWSDDTQHALAVAEGLVDAGGYDLRTIARNLKVEAQTPLGWGKTTKKAIARILPDMTEAELEVNGETSANGCGPLMRSVPLAVYAHDKSTGILEKIARQNAGITHNSPENIVSTTVHHRILDNIIRLETGDLMLHAQDLARYYEARYNAEPHLSETLRAVGGAEDIAASAYDQNGRWSAFTTWAVQAAAYGVYSRAVDSSLEQMVTAVIEEGGDTDSTAAIIAGMWALSHPESLPVEIEKLWAIRRLRRASRKLLELVV